MTTDDRREHEQDLLRHYLSALASHGVPAPAWNEAWLTYRSYLVHGFFWAVLPTAWQPVECSVPMAERYIAAMQDHNSLELLGASMTTATTSSPTQDTLMPVVEDMGIFLIAGRTKDPARALVEGEEAERLGFRRAWLSERYDLKEAGALLGGVSARTTRLEVGTGVLASGSRHPLITAAIASTMQAMYGGRFILGLGRSAGEYLAKQSITIHSLKAFADYIEIVRALLAGDAVTYDGPAGSFDELKVVDLPENGRHPSGTSPKVDRRPAVSPPSTPMGSCSSRS